MKRFLKTVGAIVLWYIGIFVIGLIAGFITNLLLDHIAPKTTLGTIIFYVIVGLPFLTAYFYLTLFITIMLERKTETIVYATIVSIYMILSLILTITNIPSWFATIGVIFGAVFGVVGKNEE